VVINQRQQSGVRVCFGLGTPAGKQLSFLVVLQLLRQIFVSEHCIRDFLVGWSADDVLGQLIDFVCLVLVVRQFVLERVQV